MMFLELKANCLMNKINKIMKLKENYGIKINLHYVYRCWKIIYLINV